MLRELRNKFETGQQPPLDGVDVHTVGSLLKAYLRDLPESIVSPGLYQRAMNFAMRYADANSDEMRASEVTGLAKLLEELPDVNYTTLAFICRFLHRLAANSEITKMNTHNLSLVYGPNLIRHMDNNPELLMLTADLTQHLAYMLIEHCHDVLPPSSSREAVKSAADGPALRGKNPGVDSVATADLLRLSQPVDHRDPSLLAPRPTALGDLMGLDFNAQQNDVCNSGQSRCSPPSPFVFVGDHFVSQKGDESPSSEARGSPCSPSLGPKPVPPMRTKSRKLRNRRSAEVTPPLSPDPSRHLDSDDILKALATASHTSQSTSEGSGVLETTHKDSPVKTRTRPAGDGRGTGGSTVPETANRQFVLVAETLEPGSQALNGEVSRGNLLSSGTVARTCVLETSATSSENQSGSGIDKVGPSRTVLEAQVSALKTELVNIKSRSERLVSALKCQLTDIRSKYEARISTMEKQHQIQVISLTAKLDIERNTSAEAVERTVSLQDQLYKYKLQYGELRDPH